MRNQSGKIDIVQLISDKLVKYKDLAGEQMAAENFQLRLKQPAINVIEGAKTLTTPAWYVDELKIKLNIKSLISDSINRNSFLNIIHVIALHNVNYKNNLEYIGDVLYRSNILDKGYKDSLIQGLSVIVKTSNAINILDPSMRILLNYRRIRSVDELLQIKPGEILFFNTLEGNSVHMLISLGNGLFSGKGNSQLCPYLKDSNNIIMAEQIGQFVGDQIEGYGSSLGK
ncbi:MAG: hypothetical protein AB8W37_02965 [Arsenophonus endosymbiont of Dermacentor nuttalli]